MQAKKIIFSTLPTIEKMKVIKSLLQEQKAENIVALDVHAHSQLTDIVLIVTAGSLRHAKALADKLAETAKKENYEFLHTEGYESAQWILVDMNDLVIHIFQDESRRLYDLESLWNEAPEIKE